MTIRPALLAQRGPLIFSVACVIVAAVAAWWPTWIVHQEHPPKEEGQYIRRVFGEHTVGQTFVSEYPVGGIEVLARVETPGVVTLLAEDAAGQSVGRFEGVVTTQDSWVRIPFTRSLPAGHAQVTIRTLPTVPQSAAVLVRYQADSTIYEDGDMWVDGETTYGDLAFRVLERGPLWRAAVAWAQVTDKSIVRGLRYIAGGLLLVLAGWLFERLYQNHRFRRWLPTAVIVTLILLAIAVRVPYLYHIEGIFGGDAFNYLSKTQTLLEGGDPFTADPRKAPLLSFLLIPGFWTPDPLLWSRWIGILAAAATVGLVPLIARQTGVPWPLAIGSGLLLAINPDFMWEAPSGLANPLFSLLIAVTIYAYFKATQSEPVSAHQARWQWLMGIGLGLITLTRYEGAVMAPILLAALWWRQPASRKRLVMIAVVAALIMAIPQLSLVWSGQSGIRTPADVAADEGLDLATSGEQLVMNVQLFERFLQQAWVSDDPKPGALLTIAVGALLGGALVLLRRVQPKASPHIALALSIGGVILLSFLVLGKNEAPRALLIFTPLFLIGSGLVAWWQARPYDVTVVMIALLAQVTTITLILPKSRYYLQLLPFFALAMAYGLYALTRRGPQYRQYMVAVFLVGLLASYIYADGQQTLAVRAEWYNGKAQNVSVMIKAAKWLRSVGGHVGFRPVDEQPALIYVPRERRFTFRAESQDETIIPAELQWLREHTIRYAVSRDPGPYWVSVAEYPDIFEHLHTFDTIHGEDRILIYRVDQNKLKTLLENNPT